MTDGYSVNNSGPLAHLGAALIDNGYSIIPIAVGKKAPGFDNWAKSRSSKPQLKEWLESGHRHAGVGILTKHTPGIDLDIRDKGIALEAEAKVREIFGDAPLRIGMAPKRLMMFRTDTPFKKMRSTKYIDQWGDMHQIEILGDGQQFVAHHTHPDTGKPYVWPNNDGPTTTPAQSLPTITPDQCTELIDWFERRAALEADWTPVKQRRSTDNVKIDNDNPFLEDTAVTDISEAELRTRLMMVPNPEDHDTWYQVGMALYHQFDGGDTGRELWDEWSETADNYDKDALERRWESFGIDGKKRAPLTARYILRLSMEAVAQTTAALGVALRDGFANAKTLVEWDKARDAAREAEIDGLTRSSLASLAKDKRDAITGLKSPLSEIKKAISYTPAKGERTPGWAEPWVYDTSDDRFFATDRKISSSAQGFNAMYDRKAMTKKDVLNGNTSPTSNASVLALNLYKIPVVNGRRYEPGADPIFLRPDGLFANTYPEHEIPALPEKLLPRDKQAIRRVKDHVRHLLVKPEERRLLVDWLSWVVQNPGRHANWSMLLQGVEGDGKSFFGFMMRAVMGVSNVQMLNAQILESPFTDWVVGQCLTCIEEVRLIKNHNKYELLNRVKPFITNHMIEVHPKGRPTYNAVNTTSYLLFSNFRDALPIDDDGRRYCILFSQWQRKDRLDAFLVDNPEYYEDLYATIELSAPALRQWLLEHEQLPTFKPFGNAPDTEARQHMIRQAQPEVIQILNDIIAEGNEPLITNELLDATRLNEVLYNMGVDQHGNKSIGAMLSRNRFNTLGRVRVGDEVRTYHSREIESFQCMDSDGKLVTDLMKVKKFVKIANAKMDDDEL